ncbi:serine/threonine protein phosphatase 2B catalytic subunit A, putative (CNA) [Plasmodium ovale wallikeri]|uniref:Serine/threonine protein phosphatase 2B catalytic subunit A, putative (CNA) n=1 Tax=Plasmodium ovale wallikeri TaxID=864142 RepID=A0A1A8YG99_PLAOA|nr:serine/threonine protein phosphatase 2B catalytic subunit A, putative (CNA) [Plasmodium ovale wallikeri]SBT31083.1 serine/threonine protein phosphatase 2B catalytic subunit A, putative (CNA) [Plasmodium ovale wallikeri]
MEPLPDPKRDRQFKGVEPPPAKGNDSNMLEAKKKTKKTKKRVTTQITSYMHRRKMRARLADAFVVILRRKHLEGEISLGVGYYLTDSFFDRK